MEEYILKILKKKFPYAYRTDCYTHIGDIIAIAFEVKYDRRCYETGNIAVEYAYKEKPSGIEATGSTHWILVTKKEVLILSVKKLKELIKTRQYKKTVGGDDNQSRLYLIPLHDLRVISTVYAR